MRVKLYTPKEWAALSPAQLAELEAEVPQDGSGGDFVAPDFGWSCRTCARTSRSYPWVSSQVSWRRHKCYTVGFGL